MGGSAEEGEKVVYWQKLSPRERDKLVATVAIGWEPPLCRGHWEALDPSPDGQYCPNCGAEKGWWDDDHPDLHNEPYPPAYSQLMGKAWELLGLLVKLHEGEQRRRPGYATHFHDFAYALLGSMAFDESYPACSLLESMTDWTAEKLCKAFLVAYGYTVIDEERNDEKENGL